MKGQLNIGAGSGVGTLFLKYDSGNGSQIFGDANWLALRAQAGQTVTIFNGSGQRSFYVLANEKTVSIPGRLHVNGNLDVEATKNFLVPHPGAHELPTPEEGKEWKLRHTCIESDLPLLMYRRTIETADLVHRFQMPPSWFPHIVTDVKVHMTPYKHHGSAWGEVLEDGHTVEIHATVKGAWHCLLTGVRNDQIGKDCVASPIEFQQEVVHLPEDPPKNLPPQQSNDP